MNKLPPNIVWIGKALADPSRVRVLWALQDGSLCICQIVELLRLAPSTISKHLRVLERAGLLKTEKKGRWVYCTRQEPVAGKGFYGWLDNALRLDPAVSGDDAALKRILKEEPVALCQRQRNRR